MKPIVKVSIIDNVVLSLKNMILSGELKVGSKIPTEKELCFQLKVGRSTVREALRMLETMGFIEIRHGVGAFVLRTTEDDQQSIAKWFITNKQQIDDFMDVRLSLEILSLKYAVLRATESDIKEIDEIHSKFESALSRKDITELVMLDEIFHDSISKATHNDILKKINSQIYNAIRPYRNKSFSVVGAAGHALLPHRAILDAIKDRDIDKAIDATKEHIEISLKDMTKVIENVN